MSLVSEAIHVFPPNDLVWHDIDEEGGACVCGPSPELATDDDGEDVWVYIHHSLDGRELDE